ncbi:MAG: FAD:protein FMN transferase [Clostridia bacterium]|nr:FAD:protein FMN transferase [Clostridia bacterium]
MKKYILIFALIILITGCSVNKADNEYSTGLFAMNTYITIDLYGENAKAAADDMSNKIRELEGLWSTTLNTSEIYQINNSGATVTVSDETRDILKFAIDMADKTGGVLNPAIYPLVKAWGFTTGDYSIPDKSHIEELLNYTDYKKIGFEGNKIDLPKNMELDLGAVGKGYTADIITQLAKDNGISSGLINLGGNVQAIGTKPDGSKWRLGLQNPFGEGNIGILEAADCAVVTSGNYEKYFVGDDGKRYCHIIDPKTGYPCDNGLVSVTIAGKEGKMCDALSTALFVMGKDNAIQYWQKNKDFEMILITEDRGIYITSGLADGFTSNDEGLNVNIID